MLNIYRNPSCTYTQNIHLICYFHRHFKSLTFLHLSTSLSPKQQTCCHFSNSHTQTIYHFLRPSQLRIHFLLSKQINHFKQLFKNCQITCQICYQANIIYIAAPTLCLNMQLHPPQSLSQSWKSILNFRQINIHSLKQLFGQNKIFPFKIQK